MSRKFTDEEVVEAALCCTAKSCDTCPFIVLGEGFEKCIIKFSEYIANNTKNEPAPVADVQEVKHGYWKFNQHSKVVASFRCSECQTPFYNFGNSKILSPTPYCPNCGARMDSDSSDG